MIITNYCFVIYMVFVIIGLLTTLYKWGESEGYYGWGNIIAIIAGTFLVFGVYKGW